jgi:two-component system response regulator AlgR
MKVLVVDDEALARARLIRQLQQLGEYAVVGEADNGEQALQAIAHYRPDIVLMDIRMPVMDGLQAARQLAERDNPPAVIFCTAYNDYAIDAFEANAVGYLLKPVNRDKLADALAKSKKLNQVQLSTLSSDSDKQRHHLQARNAAGVSLVPLDSVRYLQAEQKYVTAFYCNSSGQLCEAVLDESLKELEQQWPERWVRVHRNALVARQYIEGIKRQGEQSCVALSGIIQGPVVSRRHLSDLKRLLEQL